MITLAILETLDWVVLGGYFAALFAVAIWVILQKQKNTEDYFLAGRNVGWFVIGASIFASNIGSEHVVGLAGTGAASGMPLAHYELHAWIVLLLGWLFLPFYMRSGSFTMPEFLEKRFDARSRWFLSIFSVVGYVLTKVSVTIYAGGIVVSTLLGIDFWTGALATVIITGIYTVLGGMRAVVYTEALQTIILIIGSTLILYFGLQEVGGWGALKEFVINNPVDPANPQNNHFNMWRPPSDPEFPWTGLLIGGTIVGVWYWCTDQYIVQRTLAAENIKIGRRGAIFGAYLKILPIFIFLVPGMIAYMMYNQGVTLEDTKYEGAYYVEQTDEWKTVNQQYDYGLLNTTKEIGGVDYLVLDYDQADAIIGTPKMKPDNALPALVRKIMPPGLRGLLAAALMAALMSSLASVFNSSSTLFTIDIFKKLNPDAPEKQLVNVGRMATAVVVVLGIAWIPIMERIGGGTLYKYLQSVQAYIAPPITTVFLLGILWKRVNAQGAIATLFFGLFMGAARIVAELQYSIDGKIIEGGSGLWYQYASINFAHMAIFMFIACVIVCIIVSLMTAAPSEEKVRGLTLGSLTPEQKAANRNSYTILDIGASLVLVAIIIGILSYFTG